MQNPVYYVWSSGLFVTMVLYDSRVGIIALSIALVQTNISLKFCTYMHGPQRMTPNYCVDTLITFNNNHYYKRIVITCGQDMADPSGWSLHSSFKAITVSKNWFDQNFGLWPNVCIINNITSDSGHDLVLHIRFFSSTKVLFPLDALFLL